LGVGGKDPFGNPLSESRLAQQGRFESLLNATPNIPVGANERITADGAFKTPGLRNIELTAPYFHNGGQLTLREVVDFYNRGGDFRENNIDNVDIGIRNLNLTEEQKTSLVAFMQSLTDERVRFERAPFDHPQLFITNGHPGDQNAVTNDGTGQATTTVIELPAVGPTGLVLLNQTSWAFPRSYRRQRLLRHLLRHHQRIHLREALLSKTVHPAQNLSL
jgi:hypothetical protein